MPEPCSTAKGQDGVERFEEGFLEEVTLELSQIGTK